jgi:hypothetical protein
MELDRFRPAFRIAVLALGSAVLSLLVLELLDRPGTFNRCSHPGPSERSELADRRDEYLRIALPLLAVYGAWVASRAWKWTADRRYPQSKARRPGSIPLAGALVFGVLWAVVLGSAFASDEVGGAVFLGVLVAIAGLLSVAIVALVITGIGFFRSGRKVRAEDVGDAVSAGLAWTILLVAWPFLILLAAIAGKDSTMWC